MPLSRTVAPYAPTRPHQERQAAAGPRDIPFFIPVNNPIEADHSQRKHRLQGRSIEDELADLTEDSLAR